jgi:hypothetical protein
MQAATKILAATFPKMIVDGKDCVKGIYEGSRHVHIKYNSGADLFDVWAFTLRGTNLLKEKKEKGVLLCQLRTVIDSVK